MLRGREQFKLLFAQNRAAAASTEVAASSSPARFVKLIRDADKFFRQISARGISDLPQGGTHVLIAAPAVVFYRIVSPCDGASDGACRVTVDGKTRFVCIDGPEFDAHKVDFDEMLMRLRTYN